MEPNEMQDVTTAAYPSATSQQDTFDVSLRVRAIELAMGKAENVDEVVKGAEKILAFLKTKE